MIMMTQKQVIATIERLGTVEIPSLSSFCVCSCLFCTIPLLSHFFSAKVVTKVVTDSCYLIGFSRISSCIRSPVELSPREWYALYK